MYCTLYTALQSGSPEEAAFGLWRTCSQEKHNVFFDLFQANHFFGLSSPPSDWRIIMHIGIYAYLLLFSLVLFMD